MKYFFSFLPSADEYLSAQTVDKKLFSPPKGGRIVLSANERITEFPDFAIQAKLAYMGKLRGRIFVRRERCTFSEKSGIINAYCFK